MIIVLMEEMFQKYKFAPCYPTIILFSSATQMQNVLLFQYKNVAVYFCVSVRHVITFLTPKISQTATAMLYTYIIVYKQLHCLKVYSLQIHL